jgi:hypothetical protein
MVVTVQNSCRIHTPKFALGQFAHILLTTHLEWSQGRKVRISIELFNDVSLYLNIRTFVGSILAFQDL